MTIAKAVSTWSLHRTLGNYVHPESAANGGPFMTLPEIDGGETLLELIPDLASHGYSIIQICHFHLESRDAEYLAAVKQALAENNITLDMLLIDDGDLTADDYAAQMDWIDGWLDVAVTLGAHRARVNAGHGTPTPELLQAVGERLATLAAQHPDVRVVTENFLSMTPDAESVLTILDAAGNSVGLLVDLGNWHAPEKYDELAKIVGRAEACHAKCSFSADGPDEADFHRALGILKDAAFSGPIALIYDGPDNDEFARLDDEWVMVQQRLA
ncbi:MAG: sugar phosphate isomerase/epimerase [Thermomicrobiales bacterium]|nr:sugar phosphate isomerase/epimerase [Thermomicrobiales bacterium]